MYASEILEELVNFMLLIVTDGVVAKAKAYKILFNVCNACKQYISSAGVNMLKKHIYTIMKAFLLFHKICW
jgi:hypothetical protein